MENLICRCVVNIPALSCKVFRGNFSFVVFFFFKGSEFLCQGHILWCLCDIPEVLERLAPTSLGFSRWAITRIPANGGTCADNALWGLPGGRGSFFVLLSALLNPHVLCSRLLCGQLHSILLMYQCDLERFNFFHLLAF